MDPSWRGSEICFLILSPTAGVQSVGSLREGVWNLYPSFVHCCWVGVVFGSVRLFLGGLKFGPRFLFPAAGVWSVRYLWEAIIVFLYVRTSFAFLGKGEGARRQDLGGCCFWTMRSLGGGSRMGCPLGFTPRTTLLLNPDTPTKHQPLSFLLAVRWVPWRPIATPYVGVNLTFKVNVSQSHS